MMNLGKPPRGSASILDRMALFCYDISYKGMTGFDGANGSLAASRGALTSIIQSKLTKANNGKAFTLPDGSQQRFGARSLRDTWTKWPPNKRPRCSYRVLAAVGSIVTYRKVRFAYADKRN